MQKRESRIKDMSELSYTCEQRPTVGKGGDGRCGVAALHTAKDGTDLSQRQLSGKSLKIAV